MDGLLAVAADASLPVEGRRDAIAALGQTRSPKAAVGLGFRLQDTELQDEAVKALRALGDNAISALIQQLDKPAAATAVQALVRIGAPAFPALLRRSKQSGPGRRLAAEALAAAGYRPRSSQERAELLLIRQEKLHLLEMGTAALPAVASALWRREAGTATTALLVLLMALGLFLLFQTVLALVFLFRKRRWLRPDFRAVVSAGGRKRLAGVVKQPAEPGGEPGAILSTEWARDLLGRRRRIKVETLVPIKPGTSQGNALDLLVAAGASVQPGTYLAAAPAGSVKIWVKPG